MTVRTGRDADSRESTSRKKTYQPPNMLPDPNPEEGYVFRWVRTSITGQDDRLNVQSKVREGWEPVKAVDHPEMGLLSNESSGNIEVGGLMLCKMAKEDAEARQTYYDNLAQQQADSVDQHYMRESDPRMPLFKEKHSKTTFGGKGR